MSGMKRALAEHEAKLDQATEIAINAGVLERCEEHENTIFSTGEDIEAAFSYITNGCTPEERSLLMDDEELKKYIKEAIETYPDDYCQDC